MHETLGNRGRPLLQAIGLTVSAILAALLVAPQPSLSERYLKLCSWDCGWYQNIAAEGYHSTIPPATQDKRLANVAFFPGYPMLARGLYLAAGKPDPRLPLIWISHLFCVVFWFALLLLLKRWQVHPYARALTVFAIFAHPAAFYLVMGYSESLFLASMLLFFYWSDDPRPARRWWAAGAGFLMTATRIVGVPVVLYPLLRRVCTRRNWRTMRLQELAQPILIGVFSTLGFALFLLYCRIAFGDFSLYMKTQAIGWGIQPDYSALWNWRGISYMSSYEKSATLVSVLGLSGFWLAELCWGIFSRTRLPKQRVPLHFSAASILLITISGLKCLGFRSMIRYSLPLWLLAVLCLAQLSTESRWKLSARQAQAALLAGLGGLAWYYWSYELVYQTNFLKGWWFA